MGAAPAELLRIVAVVLAAGCSQRMAPANKLLLDDGGRPLIANVVRGLFAAGITRVIVVTGHQRQALQGALAGLPCEFAHNPDYADGLAGSLCTGLRLLGEGPEQVDGALIALGDMPRVQVATVRALVAAFNIAGTTDAANAAAICVPFHEQRRGNPVLWPAALFGEMMQAEGRADRGARHLIEKYPERVCKVEVKDDGVLRDIDTPGDCRILDERAETGGG